MNIRCKNSRIILIFSFILLVSINSVAWPADQQSNDESVLYLTLRDAIHLALESNRNLMTASNSVQNAYMSLQSARAEYDIKFFPSANIGTSNGDEIINAGLRFDKKFYSGIG